MPIRNAKEIVSTPPTAQALHDQKTRNQQKYTDSKRSIISDIDSPTNRIQKRSNNTILLGASECPGLVIDIPDTVVLSLENSIVNGSVKVPAGPDAGDRILSLLATTNCSLSNLRFLGQVYCGVNQSTTTIFHNCVFEQTVTNWGAVHFIGCTFKDSTTSVQNNLPANFAYIIGCSRQNGGAYGGAGCTIIAETT